MRGSNDRGNRKDVWNRKIRWHRLWILDDTDWGLPLWEEVASAAFGGETCNYERWWMDSSWQIGIGSYQINYVKVYCTQCCEGEEYSRSDEGFVWYVWKAVNKEIIQFEDGRELISSTTSKWI